jgi:hypothetical protein
MRSAISHRGRASPLDAIQFAQDPASGALLGSATRSERPPRRAYGGIDQRAHELMLPDGDSRRMPQVQARNCHSNGTVGQVRIIRHLEQPHSREIELDQS